MNQSAHKTKGVNRTITPLVSTGNDPRKGWRIPLNRIKYNEQRDEETGYGHFGARYMDHELITMWLSVDPMSDKYPSISPYAYCTWNPVKLVDPDGMEAEDDWVKNKKTSQYEWNKNATSPENTPYGYKYVGDDYALLRELNIRTNYDIKEDCMTGISPSMSSTHVGFTRSRACISATIIVRVCVREDIENVTSDNPSGETFDGINIIGYTNQWSRSGDMEPNGIIYNGYLAIEGSGVFFRQSPFAIPSTDTYSPSGTVPMTATVHIPANNVYNNILKSATINLGHASSSTSNGPLKFSWSLNNPLFLF